MDFIPYNSHNQNDKSIFGSIATGEGLCLSVSLPEHYKCLWINLVLKIDGGQNTHYPMQKQAGENRFRVEIKIDEAGLYWYYFEYETDLALEKITRHDISNGRLNAEGKKWQLSVYSSDIKAPKDFMGGLMYQIFPDRFRFSKQPKKDIPYGRTLRSDWGGLPEWKMTSDGKILNNDYFCGDFKGIIENLEYLASLSVSMIYLNPIFEAHSNHRYDTADYMKVDPLLGTEEDFIGLCETAKKHGIKIILDGVFSHTGADSIYFNKEKRYSSVGAYNSRESKYFSWYNFKSFPDDYECWWNIKILPELDEENDDFIDFITGKNGVVSKWMKLGASGFRIDVADELPDKFLDALHLAVKRENPNGLILGEVWEDASNKISHGGRRRYLFGKQLDSVMNYPFRTAIINFAKGGNAEVFINSIMTIVENYPPPALHLAMNHLGTHDTARILTSLSSLDLNNESRQWQSKLKLSDEQKTDAKQLLKLAAIIQYTLPGIPSLYYGDELSMEGGRDPFNRGCFPLSFDENDEIFLHFKALGRLRAENNAYKNGRFSPLSATASCIAFYRQGEGEKLITIANKNEHEIIYYLPSDFAIEKVKCILGGEIKDGGILISANTAVVLKYKN